MKSTPQPDPTLPFELPLTLARDGRFAEAVRETLALAGDSTDETLLAGAAQSLSRIARQAEGAGDLAAAEAALERAVNLRPTWADLHFQYATVLAQRGRLAEARTELRAALAIHPRYLAARVETAMLEAREGRIGEALSALREVQRDTRIEEPHAFQQGLRSLERADWDTADALFRRAVKRTDPRLERQLDRYRTYMAESELERAADVLREALDAHESYPDLHAMLGTSELRIGHYDDAVASFARALELNPEFHTARVQLALALDALGARAEATEQLALVLEADPGHAQACEILDRWAPRVRLDSDSSSRKGS
jgi:tetratricopeptide (TPR) repeat protein